MIINTEKFKASVKMAGIALQKMIHGLEKGIRENTRMHRYRGKIGTVAMMQELVKDDETATVMVHKQEALDDLCVNTSSRDERNDKNYLNIHSRKKKGGKKCY